MHRSSPRAQFIELATQIHRAAGESPRDFDDVPGVPMAMKLRRQGITFELVHDPGPAQDCFLLRCELLSQEAHGNLDRHLERALATNQSLMRSGAGAIGWDDNSSALIWSCRFPVAGAGVEQVNQAIESMGAIALHWRGAA
jgi:hypothetical protein